MYYIVVYTWREKIRPNQTLQHIKSCLQDIDFGSCCAGYCLIFLFLFHFFSLFVCSFFFCFLDDSDFFSSSAAVVLCRPSLVQQTTPASSYRIKLVSLFGYVVHLFIFLFIYGPDEHHTRSQRWIDGDKRQLHKSLIKGNRINLGSGWKGASKSAFFPLLFFLLTFISLFYHSSYFLSLFLPSTSFTRGSYYWFGPSDAARGVEPRAWSIYFHRYKGRRLS